ncbi:hypothetical protein [Actinopolyspora halophila]|uniref:hypothetical protein n=1 Tax=Actinopolyspora halophila TaxID=1850 RepID=UPI00039E8BE8|nr:hypothetical protein [Actinopolyspora halophila]
MPLRVRTNWKGPRVTAETRAGGIAGLRLAAEHLLGESRKVVPLETGTLSRSGVAEVDESSLTAAVSYDTPYAVRQHEELTWRHDSGRMAKYLERPTLAEAETMQELIASQIRRALNG